jgi:DNA ligase (NAD+)
MSKRLLNELLNADALYYSTGKSPLSDAEYDSKRDEFRALEPQHPYLKTVGAKLAANAKPVKHRLISGSQEKLKSPEEIQAWAVKGGKLGYKEQWKLDGYTLVLTYLEGILTEAASRGDGEVGESVLWNAVLLSSVPKRLSRAFTGDVRGECVLSKTKFAKFFAPLGYSNPRNAVAVIRDQKGTGMAEHLDFIAFDINVEPQMDFKTETERTLFMQALGFTTVDGWLAETPQQIQSIWANLAEQRSKYDYEVDGVVVRYESIAEQQQAGTTSDFRPKGQKCIKFANDEAETTCIGYEITMGSTGALIPTLKFNTVELGGAKVSSVLGCNFPLLKERGIHVGDKVILSRRGGVIPYVESVSAPGADRKAIEAPKECPYCGSKTFEEGAYVKCSNEDCEGRGFRQLLSWVRKREIKQLGETLLQELYDNHSIKFPQDLYTLTYPVLSQVQLSGRTVGTGAKTVLAEIEKSKQCPLTDLMGSVSIKLLGRREAELIMGKTGIKSLGEWFSLTESQLLSVEGYQDTKANAIVAGIKKARPVILALVEAGVEWFVEAPKTTVPGGALSGQVLVFTGAIQKCDATGARFTRKRMQELAKNAGADLSDEVRDGVTMLVTAEVDSTSSKMKKAKQLGVKIVHENDFFSGLGL